MSIVANAREWLLLNQLQSRVEGVPEEVRAEASRLLALSRERAAAAESLWLAGHAGESVRLAREAVELAREAVGDADQSLPTASRDIERYRQLRDLHARLLCEHEPLMLGPRAVSRRRRVRVALAALSLVMLCFSLVAAVRLRNRVRVVASAQYGEHYTALDAIDGDQNTEWLLPDHAAGFIDVLIVPRRRVARVKLMNARNIPFDDRATRDVAVEAFDGSRVVKTGAATFEGPSRAAAWRTIEVGATVDRLRVHVNSWHAAGGGFAEIVVE